MARAEALEIWILSEETSHLASLIKILFSYGKCNIFYQSLLLFLPISFLPITLHVKILEVTQPNMLNDCILPWN